MYNKKDRLCPPSSFASGYNQKHKYDLTYPTQKRVGYTFNYYDKLRRKLNYIFNYMVFPRYGRYTFIYDSTDSILVEKPILLKRDIKDVSYEKEYLLKKKRYNELHFENGKDVLVEKDIFKTIHDSIMYDLKNVERTIDWFIYNSKIENVSSGNRNISLFSKDDYIARRVNENISVEDRTIFDFSIDNSIEFISNEMSNEGLLVGVDSRNRDISYIQDSLKNDIKLRSIMEELYIHSMSEMNITKESKHNSFDANVPFMDKTSKDSNIVDDYTGVIKVPKLNFNDNEYLIEVQKDDKLVSVEIDEKVDIFKKEKDISIISDITVETSKVAKQTDYNNDFENFNIKKKIKDIINEEIHKEILAKNDKYNFEVESNNDNINLSIKTPTRELPNMDIIEKGSLVSVNRYCEKEIIDDCNDSKLERGATKDNFDILDDVKQINRQAKYGIPLFSEKDNVLESAGARKLDQNNDVVISPFASKNIQFDDNKAVKKDDFKEVSKENTINQLGKIASKNVEKESNVLHENAYSKQLEVELDKQLNLHKRFWFVKSLGKIDYKILPNKDVQYPTDINIFLEKPNYDYRFSFDAHYQNILSDSFVVELYSREYQLINTFEIKQIKTGNYSNGIVSVDIDTFGNKAKFDLKIQHNNLYYMIIRQPKDVDGYPVLYTATKKFLGENIHPIPFGTDLGANEIAIHLNVMVDFINIMMLMWSKFYYQFTGYTGIQAIYGMVNLVHEWVTLDSSLEVDNIEEFHRCFRWLRWEAEKLYNIAKNDPNLTGNAWIEELIYQLVEYMEMHHMNELPEFNPTHLMDEYRNIFDDPSFDIDIITDKVKGVRKRAIDTNKISRNKNSKKE